MITVDEVKSVNESWARLIPGPNAASFNDEMYDKLFDYMGGNIRAYDEEQTPIPWDCDVIIKDGKFILDGGVGPSGFGRCRCEVPLKDAGKTYFLELHDVDPDDVQYFKDAGWEVKKG